MELRQVILIAALCVSPLSAADVSDDVLQSLANPEYTVRQQATVELLTADDLTLDRIVDLYKKAWSVEQRERLMSVAYHHALAESREELMPQEGGDGAMGITQKGLSAEQLPELGQPAVVVMATFPGFPGHAHLQPGDLILAVNDRGFAQHLPSASVSQEFGRMVREVQADQELSLTVRRHGQLQTVRMRLAALESLTRIYSQQRNVDERFLARWRQLERRLSMLNPPDKPIQIEKNPTSPMGMNTH